MLGAGDLYTALIITHLFVVSNRLRSENQEFNGQRRYEKSIIDNKEKFSLKIYARNLNEEKIR